MKFKYFKSYFRIEILKFIRNEVITMCKIKEHCKHPEKMTGKDPDDCTLKQIGECRPALYKKNENVGRKCMR